MSIRKALIAAAGSSDSGVQAVTFDGTNDYLSRGAGLTGAADGTTLSISVWVKFNSVDNNMGIINGLFPEGGRLDYNNGDYFDLRATKPSGIAAAQVRSSSSYSSTSTWYHVLASIDNSIGGNNSNLYINDSSDKSAIDNVDFDGSNIDFTTTDFHIGANQGGTDRLNGDIAELWFALEYIDFSVEANRRKFIGADGKPVDLGADGSTPTGNQPIIYLSGNASNFATNKGAGGGFTVNGALTDASTSPSD